MMYALRLVGERRTWTCDPTTLSPVLTQDLLVCNRLTAVSSMPVSSVLVHGQADAVAQLSQRQAAEGSNLEPRRRFVSVSAADEDRQRIDTTLMMRLADKVSSHACNVPEGGLG